MSERNEKTMSLFDAKPSEILTQEITVPRSTMKRLLRAYMRPQKVRR